MRVKRSAWAFGNSAQRSASVGGLFETVNRLATELEESTPISSQEEMAMDEQISGLSRRVRRLESYNRIHLVVSTLAVAAVVVVGQLPSIWANGNGPKSFSAQEFVLVDSSGRTTARLAAAPAGGAALTFYDPDGKRTVAFGFDDDANIAGATLYDGNILAPGSGILRGNVSIGGPKLAGQPNRAPGIGLALWQPNGHFVLSAATGLDGTGPALLLDDPSGNIRAGMDVDSDNNFVGAFTRGVDGDAIQSIAGGTYDGTAAYDILFDGAGTLEALNYVSGDGSFSADQVYDAKGILRVQSYQDPTEAPVQGVKVFDSTGTVVGHLP
jgi:hypothetical protein